MSDLTGQAYVPRYASIVFPGVLLLVALGVASFGDARLRLAALVVMAGLGVVGIQPIMAYERTQAASVARQLRAAAQPGDVVAYCPDQLGPSVSRLLPDVSASPRSPTRRRTARSSSTGSTTGPRSARPTCCRSPRSLLDRAGPNHNVWSSGRSATSRSATAASSSSTPSAATGHGPTRSASTGTAPSTSA